MQFLVWIIDTPDFGVIAAVNLNQLAISGIISCLYIAANTITNPKQH